MRSLAVTKSVALGGKHTNPKCGSRTLAFLDSWTDLQE